MTNLAYIACVLLVIFGLAGFGVALWQRRLAAALAVLAAVPLVLGFTLDVVALRTLVDDSNTGGLYTGWWYNLTPTEYDAPFYLGFALLSVAGGFAATREIKRRVADIKNRAAVPQVETFPGHEYTR